MAMSEEERKARKRAYYEKNKEKEKARSKAYYEKNKERNREKEKARKKAWYENNKEKEKARSKAWNENNKEKVSARKQSYYEKNKERLGDSRRARKYGMAPGAWERLVDSQDGCCSACGREGDLCVDHNHLTGDLRGAICGPCNRGIGLLGDDIDGLMAAVAYLTPTPEREEFLKSLMAENDE